MIKAIYLILVIASLFSCDANGTSEPEQPEDAPIENAQLGITGTWKLTENYLSIGGPGFWSPVEDGGEFTFLEDNTFITTHTYPECEGGNYSLEDNILYLEYACNEFDTDLENEKGFVTYSIDLKSNSFTFHRTSGPICIEGCASRYVRQ